jgi:hypothetical protein
MLSTQSEHHQAPYRESRALLFQDEGLATNGLARNHQGLIYEGRANVKGARAIWW